MTESAVETPVTFDALPLSPDVRRALDAMGFTHPTPVQRAVFEPASRGKSVVVQARTGTGKTVAFGLPMVETLVKRHVKAVQALVLTPTRELALQVGRELAAVAQFRDLSIVPIYGGAPMGKQIDALAAGAQIVTGTPGRVLDHLRRGTLDPSQIAIFVLDEADEMLSMGFAKELHAIMDRLPKDRQGLFFSATIPPDIERMAEKQLRDPEFITLSSDAVGALSIQHYVYVVHGDKRAALARIVEVENPESAIVFCNTKDETERLSEFLMNRGYDSAWLNGDLEQNERERIMARTREGKLRFLVATDVAARGIDISHLTHVINFDFPDAAEQYVHRTGRTGRAGRTGTAISLVDPKAIGNLYMLRLTYKIRPLEKQLPTDLDNKSRIETDLVASFQSAFATSEVHPDDLALARRLLTHEDAEAIVAGLLRTYLGAREAVGENPKQLASEARRAKNPPPFVPVAAPPSAASPNTPRAPVSPVRKIEPPREAPAEPRKDTSQNARPEPRQETRPDVQADARRDEPRETRPERPRRDPPPPRIPNRSRDGRLEGKMRDRPRDGDDRGRDDEPLVIGWTESPAGPPAIPAAAPPRRDGRVPHTSYTSWTPKEENDDDQPILTTKSPSEPVPPAPVQAAAPVPPPVHAPPAPPPVHAPTSDERDERAAPSDDAGDFIEIFLNVGRREGVRPPDLQAFLAARAGLTRELTGPIRVRDRMTFVSVRPADFDRAVAALQGEVIGGRTVVAARARSSRGPEGEA